MRGIFTVKKKRFFSLVDFRSVCSGAFSELISPEIDRYRKEERRIEKFGPPIVVDSSEKKRAERKIHRILFYSSAAKKAPAPSAATDLRRRRTFSVSKDDDDGNGASFVRLKKPRLD